jgi:hypothetical protein
MMTINKNAHAVEHDAAWFPSMLSGASRVRDVQTQREYSVDGWTVPGRSMQIFIVE